MRRRQATAIGANASELRVVAESDLIGANASELRVVAGGYLIGANASEWARPGSNRRSSVLSPFMAAFPPAL